MTSIRIALVSALAVTAVLAGGSLSQHKAAPSVGHSVALSVVQPSRSDPGTCCDEI